MQASHQPPSVHVDRPDPVYVTGGLRTWRRWTDVPLLIVAVGSLPLLLLDIERDQLAHSDVVFLDVMNVVVLIAFAVDYFAELALASHRRVYVRREWTSALIVIAQALALVPGLNAVGVLRALRGARVLRMLVVVARMFAVGGAARQEGRAVLRRKAATLALGVAGLTWLTSAVGFTLAEDVGQDGRVHSFFDALWWSTATITTVGYGDIAPVTVGGRLVGMVTMVVGISTFAVVTAKIAEWLVRVGREDAAQADPQEL